jgi:hypothetical protein
MCRQFKASSDEAVCCHSRCRSSPLTAIRCGANFGRVFGGAHGVCLNSLGPTDSPTRQRTSASQMIRWGLSHLLVGDLFVGARSQQVSLRCPACKLQGHGSNVVHGGALFGVCTGCMWGRCATSAVILSFLSISTVVSLIGRSAGFAQCRYVDHAGSRGGCSHHEDG